MYMNPSSWAPSGCAPALTALPTRSSTSSRLSADSPTIVSRLLEVSATSSGEMKPLKNGSAASMTEVSSLTIIRLAFSSVNCSSNEKPMLPKNPLALARSFTGRFMNVIRGMGDRSFSGADSREG
jgi:hypothetical protein